MKQPTLKQQLAMANQNVTDVFYALQRSLGLERILELLLEVYNEKLCYTERDIEDEQAFINENRTGAYAGAGRESKAQLKVLKNKRKEQAKLVEALERFITQHKKLAKL